MSSQQWILGADDNGLVIKFGISLKTTQVDFMAVLHSTFRSSNDIARTKKVLWNLKDFLLGQSGRSSQVLIEFYFSFKYFTSCMTRWLLRFVSFYGHLSFYCTSTAFCPPIIRFFLPSLSMLKRLLQLFHTKKRTFKTELIKRSEASLIFFFFVIFEELEKRG